MTSGFSGIERRFDELKERLARLGPLGDKSRSEFDRDPYLRDIVERNLEVAAQMLHRDLPPHYHTGESTQAG